MHLENGLYHSLEILAESGWSPETLISLSHTPVSGLVSGKLTTTRLGTAECKFCAQELTMSSPRTISGRLFIFIYLGRRVPGPACLVLPQAVLELGILRSLYFSLQPLPTGVHHHSQPVFIFVPSVLLV